MARTLLRITGLWLLHLAITVVSFVVLLGLVTRERPRGTVADLSLEILRVVNGALIEPGRSVLSAWEAWLGPATSISAMMTVLGLNSLVWAIGLYAAIQLGAGRLYHR